MSALPRIKTKQDWINFLNSGPKTLSDLLNMRLACYNAIQTERKRPLIIYYVRFLPPVEGTQGLVNIDLTDIDGFTDLLNSIPKDADSIDVLIHSPGGYPDATERIVALLRGRFKEVHFLIPHSAYSAATMLALSGNTITLHPSATMGPIDPQINGTPARSIARGFEKVKEKVKAEGPESLPAYIPLIEKYSIALLEQCEDALNLSKALVTKWLADYMLNDGTDHKKQISDAVEYFSNYDEHKTHSRPLNLSKISQFNLAIAQADSDLAELLWEAHLLIDGLFESTPFVKLFENALGVSWARNIPPPQTAPAPSTPSPRAEIDIP
jgi:hypothetical protein